MIVCWCYDHILYYKLLALIADILWKGNGVNGSNEMCIVKRIFSAIISILNSLCLIISLFFNSNTCDIAKKKHVLVSGVPTEQVSN